MWPGIFVSLHGADGSCGGTGTPGTECPGTTGGAGSTGGRGTPIAVGVASNDAPADTSTAATNDVMHLCDRSAAVSICGAPVGNQHWRGRTRNSRDTRE